MPDCNCYLCYLSVSCLDANYLLNVCLLAVCFSTVWLSALCLSVCCLPVWNPSSGLQLGAMVRISLSPCCISVCVSAFTAVCLLTVRSLSVLHSTVCLICHLLYVYLLSLLPLYLLYIYRPSVCLLSALFCQSTLCHLSVCKLSVTFCLPVSPPCWLSVSCLLLAICLQFFGFLYDLCLPTLSAVCLAVCWLSVVCCMRACYLCILCRLSVFCSCCLSVSCSAIGLHSVAYLSAVCLPVFPSVCLFPECLLSACYLSYCYNILKI